LIVAIEWSKRVVDAGAGEILLTSIDREGTGEGYDLELVDTIASSVTVPVIASGGAGKKEHIEEVVSIGNADAVSAASLFHYNYWKMIDREKLVIYKNELRMGKHIDIGNIDFLMNGYGGNQDIMVDPISINEAKNMVFSKGNENVGIG
jgi:Imidazoleglycerol-phosphate synthase